MFIFAVVIYFQPFRLFLPRPIPKGHWMPLFLLWKCHRASLHWLYSLWCGGRHAVSGNSVPAIEGTGIMCWYWPPLAGVPRKPLVIMWNSQTFTQPTGKCIAIVEWNIPVVSNRRETFFVSHSKAMAASMDSALRPHTHSSLMKVNWNNSINNYFSALSLSLPLNSINRLTFVTFSVEKIQLQHKKMANSFLYFDRTTNQKDS